MFYEVAAKVMREDKYGGEKEVTERYLVDCLLFSEAEASVMIELNNECDVCAINRSRIIEIVKEIEGDELYFKAKITITTIDDSGKEKEQSYYCLVGANDVKQATERMLEYMKQGMTDMRLDAINKTKFLDILKS